MASGMNGQQFEFCGYLPIENSDRIKRIKELEAQSLKFNSTKIFIETPYRNDQLFDAIVSNCGHETRLCIAQNITSPLEVIKTMTIKQWKSNKPSLHKIPVIFLLQGI
jgi:16S rRNA (cytidine1402-2'-O)-methyltransferase